MTRTPQRFVLFGFASTHDALDAEAVLVDLGIDVVPIPAPRSFSSLCGIALRIRPDEEARSHRYLDAAGIVIKSQEEVEDV